jgi:hypothetical protein
MTARIEPLLTLPLLYTTSADTTHVRRLHLRGYDADVIVIKMLKR